MITELISAVARLPAAVRAQVQKFTLKLTPTTPLTGNPTARETNLEYNSDQPIGNGSWMVGERINATIEGSGTHDKIVIKEARLFALGSGRIKALLFYEGIPVQFGDDAFVESMCGYYWPNLVPVHPDLLDHVGTYCAFANQDPRAMIQNMGRYVDSEMRDVGPPFHPGMYPGRYYSAPYRTLVSANTVVGRWDLMPIYIPARTRLRKLGLNCLTANASGAARIGLYTAISGTVGLLKAQGAVTLAATGEREADIDVTVDAGFYWLVLQTNVAANISYHTAQSSDHRVSMYGQSAGALSDTNTQRSAYIAVGSFADFPAAANALPTFAAADVEPHLWVRCSA